MRPDEARAWLEAHINLEALGVPAGTPRRAAGPTLERMAALGELLGSPQLEYPVVHVTGTNGKTSATRLTAALLVASGLSVGAYTSPDLETVNERIAWNGHPIDDETLDELLALVATIEPHLPQVPSYFEILTGVAYRWFADVAVEAAVVEVGLGGRWDATNIADGRVAMVTNVSIDHAEFLGPTRFDIATEKAGIVKPGSTLALGETDPEVQAPFLARDAAAVLVRGQDFGVSDNRVAHGGRLLGLFTPAARYEDVFLSLHGAHQADNAAIALVAAETLLGRPLPAELVADVLGQAQAPGRLEVVGHAPLVLLDGAHNVAGAHALREALAEEFPASARTLVVGVLREKDPAEMLEALGARTATRIVACEAPSPRALPAAEVGAAARALGLPAARVDAVPNVGSALDAARAQTPADGQIVVTGSLYVVGAARCRGASGRHDRPVTDRRIGSAGELPGRCSSASPTRSSGASPARSSPASNARGCGSWRWNSASSTPASRVATTKSTATRRSSTTWSRSSPAVRSSPASSKAARTPGRSCGASWGSRTPATPIRARSGATWPSRRPRTSCTAPTALTRRPARSPSSSQTSPRMRPSGHQP